VLSLGQASTEAVNTGPVPRVRVKMAWVGSDAVASRSNLSSLVERLSAGCPTAVGPELAGSVSPGWLPADRRGRVHAQAEPASRSSADESQTVGLTAEELRRRVDAAEAHSPT
jgi:hypothetical protein